MEKQSNDRAGWTPCEPGTLLRMVGKQRQWRNFRRSILVAAAVLLAITGATLLRSTWQNDSAAPAAVDYYYGGMTCSEVVPLLDDFASGRVDAGTRARMVEHLRLCGKCRSEQERLRTSSERSARLPMVVELPAIARLPRCGQAIHGRVARAEFVTHPILLRALSSSR